MWAERTARARSSESAPSYQGSGQLNYHYRLACQVLQEIRLVLEILGDQRIPYHALFPLLSGMRGVMNLSLGKSGFVFDRAEKLARFAG